jgi:hypothetical protein
MCRLTWPHLCKRTSSTASASGFVHHAMDGMSGKSRCMTTEGATTGAATELEAAPWLALGLRLRLRLRRLPWSRGPSASDDGDQPLMVAKLWADTAAMALATAATNGMRTSL